LRGIVSITFCLQIRASIAMMTLATSLLIGESLSLM
jgi:hypothetical protein